MKFSNLIIAASLIVMIPGCNTKKSGEPKTEAFEISDDKKLLESYYELPHIKEWYTQRVQPPPFDYQMDLSKKNYLELVRLRNEIFARNGYLFMDAPLRSYFNKYKWYQPLFEIPDFKVQLNAQEEEFVKKVKALEDEKLKEKYITSNGYKMISPAFMFNPGQFSKLNDSLLSKLKRMNFFISKADREQLFYTYDENQYGYVPNFITTDLYLQLLHLYLSNLLGKAEQKELINDIGSLTATLREKSQEEIKSSTDPAIKKASKWANTYLSIANKLISDSLQITVDPSMKQFFTDEVGKINTAEGIGSKFLGQEIIEYSQFKPRGSYTKSEKLKSYFKCVKWLNSASFTMEDNDQFLASLLIALWIKNDASATKNFDVFNKVIGTFAGVEDGVGISHLITILDKNGIKTSNDLITNDALSKIKSQISMLDVDRIKPKSGNELAKSEFGKKKIFFTAGRYTFDAEIMIRLVEVVERKRVFPKGLDVFASLGNKTAESILLNEFKESQQWPAYPDSLRVLKKQFGDFNEWNASIYNKTMESINSLSIENSEYPLFMLTKFWQKKNLNTALAAWSELKHDMLLYTEQPGGAEAGEGGGPPFPQHVSYVEPNINFWKKSIELLDYQMTTLKALNALDPRSEAIGKEIKELGELLLTISNKEVKKEMVTETEFDALSWIGGKIEGITFRIMEAQYLPEREKHIGLVADVYAFNSTVLEEAVGAADEIFVIVEINDHVYLAKGAVFSYYEFQSDTRLTDEEWQANIANGKIPQRPSWLNEIYVKKNSIVSDDNFEEPKH